MKTTQEGVCVGTSHNAHFIGGLVGSKKLKAKNYVENQPDYSIKTYHSFVDGLLASITFSIYTPTTTKFYVPAKAAKKMQKNLDDDDDED
ncbi:MAG: Bor family protein [Prevotella sp.]|nr:Bor family protein [Prevotella sp.]